MTLRYATEAGSPSLQLDEGALWVWVEAIMMFSGAMPHRPAAIFLASSHDSSATPRLSTTTMASVVAPSKPAASSVQVLGVGDLLTQLANCCHPVPGDEIIGYITRSRGVTVHRQDCYNVVCEDEKERLVPVQWQETGSLYPVTVQIEAWDRVGLIRDITTIIAEEKVNITAASTANHDDNTITLHFTLETTGLAHLSQLLVKIEGVRGVISVTRIRGEAARAASVSKLGLSDKT